MHAHPELSMQESRTASLIAGQLRAAGYDVTTKVGKTGVVGLLRNGDGPTVMLRADPDIYAKAKAAGETNKIPTNHNPYFAPVMQPTLETGVKTMVVGTLAWLST